MRFDIVTVFPRMCEAFLAEGVVGRGAAAGTIDVTVHDLRDFTSDRHRVVDDVPYGGGPGMVLKPEPMFRAVDHIRATRGPGRVVLTSPQGTVLNQREAERLAGLEHLIVLCGRYEGVDERVREHLADEEISIGDYVLSGGELPALVILDAVARLVPGVVGDRHSVERDSFSRGLLDYPHYTRPAEFRGWTVPEVLLSGHHQRIEDWRRREAIRRTMTQRPDLLAEAALDAGEQEIYRDLVRARGEGADDERD